ncbi:MAG: sugar phosphate nucleotidyltransferase [Planctomycetota bacterium]
MTHLDEPMPPAMILCGGQGTRLRDVTELLPKPMVTIGAQPILWHIMKGYAAFGVKRFILCLGYKREVFIDYFLNYHARSSDFTITLGRQQDIAFHGSHEEVDWQVTLADTGDQTMTGGRVARACRYLQDSDGHFFLTYGDAVSDIDFSELLTSHYQADKTLTLSAVRQSGRFGELRISGAGEVTRFTEKPATEEGYINGGFMVANRARLMPYLSGDASLVFETGVMPQVQQDAGMHAYQHDGFWQCMDHIREHELLNNLWAQGDAPWAGVWS